VEKAEALSHLTDIRWHMIGHLQRNKAKRVVPHACAVHTVDSERLAAELSSRASALAPGKDRLRVFVQVNVAGEAQKSGCSPENLGAILEAVEAEPHLELTGLMTIPPLDAEGDRALEYFKALARLRNEHGGAFRLPELSMGMSHDFVQAIQAGATMVRVGSAIFGARQPEARS
jgi:pyridoxal phosphate enzyme (YggS family)